MRPIDYLNSVLNRYITSPLLFLPFTPAYQTVVPILREWGNTSILDIGISGSNAKGTAIMGVADLDLFISLHPSVLDRYTLEDLYNSLAQKMSGVGYVVRRQNVSVRVNHGGTEVDIVPGVKFAGNTSDHWLHVTRSGRDRIKTNIDEHIRRVSNSGRINEIRLAKIWRKLCGLDFPSIYLEETVINCLSGYLWGDLDVNFLRILDFLSNSFTTTTVIDPANSANIVSNDLTAVEKNAISTAARISRIQPTWGTIVW